MGETLALIAETEEDLKNVQDCGTDCIVSGSGGRHDGTTAVDSRSLNIGAKDNSTMESSSTSAVVAPDSDAAQSSASGEEIPKPDVVEIWMPALSSTMESGKIDAYYVNVGDSVKQGDIIMAVESDKASMDVEAFESGIFAHISVDVGEECKVNDIVAYMAKTEADVPKVQAWAKSRASASSSSSTAEVKVEKTEAERASASEAPEAFSERSIAVKSDAPIVNTGRIVASPLAKKRARELNVDLSRVRGSGPNGRIIEKDVLSAKSMQVDRQVSQPSGAPQAQYKRSDSKIIATPEAKKIAKAEKIDLVSVTGTGNFGRITATDVLKAAGKYTEEIKAPAPVSAAQNSSVSSPSSSQSGKDATARAPEGAVTMTSAQKSVVKTMNASLAVPVFRVEYSIKTSALDDLYAKVKSKDVTMSALLAKAVAITLKKHPIMNAAYDRDAIVYRPNINIAMAVSLPDGGLMTPVLNDSDKVDLYTLSRTWKDLVKRTMGKSLKPSENSGGTFYISNLGMFGVDSFDAILPPGAPCILAVAASKPVVAVQSNGLVGVHKEMKVNITCDHRHIYGANAAEFLRDLANLIENNVTELVL